MPFLGLLLGQWKLVLLGLALAAVAFLNWRLDACKAGRAADRVQAEAREKALGTQIEVQNRAVAALEAESKAKMAKAQEGLKSARSASQAARTEADRLRAAGAQPAPTSQACPAGDAVRIVREGLAK